MEFTFELGFMGLVIMTIGSVAVGVLFYLVGNPELRFEWLATAIGAFIGGFIASEFVLAFRDFEPVYDGLAVVPALIGGLIVGGVVAGAARVLTRTPLSPQTR